MSRIQIPLDVLTSRLNIQDRFSGFRNTSLSSRFANMKPVGEFLDFKRLSKPANFGEVQSRVNYNLGTFSSNYALVFVLLSVYALITNPLLLFDIVLLVGGLWLLGRLGGQDLTIGTFHATSSQLYTGLLVTFGLIFLIASPFATVLWLIGFFRGGGLDGRPRAPEFAPQWGRPSRRERKRWAAPGEEGIWDTGHRVVEELDSDDTDTQGVGLPATRGRRYPGDPLRFTGIDLGGGGSGSRHRSGYPYPQPDDDSTDDDSQDTSEDTEDEDQAAARAQEEALVQGAFARIRKAQAKGKQEVKLNKEELAALDRRRKRLQAEAEKAKKREAEKANGSDRSRRKEKEQRYAVPLTQIDPSLARGLTGPSASDDALPRHTLPSTLAQSQERPGPPMGLFPPPNASRSRPRSGTSSSYRPPSTQDSPPFSYQYVHPAANPRHASDPSMRPSSSQSSRNNINPFQYQTAGPRASYRSGAPASGRRNVSNPSDPSYGAVPPGLAPAAARSSSRRPSSEETSEEEEEEETTSDEQGNGAQIARNQSREEIVVVEPPSPEPEPERPKPKKASPSSTHESTAKRKPVGGGSGGGRRRKGR
ncbi:PRA1 family protein-domain-containing protein [Whalleya microplaca]|nr:PRA1 family protein-domain-containing protein [Whalleya microplaca]